MDIPACFFLSNQLPGTTDCIGLHGDGRNVALNETNNQSLNWMTVQTSCLLKNKSVGPTLILGLQCFIPARGVTL